jgi:hypothetical protein
MDIGKIMEILPYDVIALLVQALITGVFGYMFWSLKREVARIDDIEKRVEQNYLNLTIEIKNLRIDLLREKLNERNSSLK